MKRKQSSLSDDLAETASEIGNFELPAEVLEFSIDQVLDSGILKDVPFVGWIAKGLSLGRSVSDRILYNKIIRFIYALDELNSSPVKSFRDKLNKEPEYKRKVGEHLLLTLDKLNDLSKPEMVARCFDHFLTGDIDFDMFAEFSHAIEQSTVLDLKILCSETVYPLNFSNFGRATDKKGSGCAY